MKAKHRYSIYIVLVIAAIAGWFFFNRTTPNPIPPNTGAELSPAKVATPVPTLKPTDLPKPGSPLPTTLLLKVPFTPQAPTANWDELHNEACEEASSIMAYAYFSGSKETTLPPDYVETEITKLTAWQDQNFGYHLDTSSAETAEMIEKVYGLKTKLINNFTEDDIKQELSQNHVVLVSEYGRGLNNPNYKTPGPIHHMLVIKGYTKDTIITNDSGTHRGLNYAYPFSTIQSAAADWDQTLGSVNQNKKIAIVVYQN